MKTIFAFALLLSALACHKANHCDDDKMESKTGNQQITGKWELRKATGGIAPLIEYAPGKGRTWQFNSNNTFVFASNTGTVYETGTYTLLPTGTSGEYTLQITTSFVNILKIKLSASELIHIPQESCCDMQTEYFTKL
jgi:hypothetical protein